MVRAHDHASSLPSYGPQRCTNPVPTRSAAAVDRSSWMGCVVWGTADDLSEPLLAGGVNPASREERVSSFVPAGQTLRTTSSGLGDTERSYRSWAKARARP